ncbi:ABC transporter substrate-binding protein [Rhizobium sp. ARZ01]|nr:ABC transporter substrate-binding protein [Rhizobium sp. ARZ01]
MLATAFAIATLLSQPVNAGDVTFVTEEYAPFSYTDSDTIKGIAVEQVHRIAASVGLSYRIEIMPWARAIALAERQPDHCVFTTGHNRARDKTFRWVEPLLKDQMVIVKRKGDKLAATTLEAAHHQRVGAQRGDFAVGVLKEHGFTDIDLAADIAITLGKLKSGRIDLMPTSVKIYESMLKDGEPIEKAMLLDGQTYGIACHKAMPAKTIVAMQNALDELISSGQQDAIFTAYGLPPNTRTASR